MEIILAKTAGFCFGVKRAVDMAFEQTDSEQTYTFGPIIHNEVVTNELAEKGIKATDDIATIEAKKIIIRSHGVSPTVYEACEHEGIEVVDATCPYVKKIHRIVAQYADAGYGIIIAGNSVHPEIQGINGWAKESCIILKDVNDVQRSGFEDKKYLLVAQTTYKKSVVEEILEALKAKGVEVEFKNTICSATKERQDEALSIARQADVMLVLGSRSSSNTAKLQEICEANCKKSYCIAGIDELTNEMTKGCEVVGITAGASTPHSVIESVIEKLSTFE